LARALESCLAVVAMSKRSSAAAASGNDSFIQNVKRANTPEEIKGSPTKPQAYPQIFNHKHQHYKICGNDPFSDCY